MWFIIHFTIRDSFIHHGQSNHSTIWHNLIWCDDPFQKIFWGPTQVLLKSYEMTHVRYSTCWGSCRSVPRADRHLHSRDAGILLLLLRLRADQGPLEKRPQPDQGWHREGQPREFVKSFCFGLVFDIFKATCKLSTFYSLYVGLLLLEKFFCFLLFEGIFTSFFKNKKPERSHKTVGIKVFF